jgi:hypothetical protein
LHVRRAEASVSCKTILGDVALSLLHDIHCDKFSVLIFLCNSDTVSLELRIIQYAEPRYRSDRLTDNWQE